MKTYIPDPPRLFLISEFSGGVHFSSKNFAQKVKILIVR